MDEAIAVTPGQYRLELHRVGTRSGPHDRLTLTAPLTSTGQIDTDDDLRFQALWDGYEYDGDLVLVSSSDDHVHELHWDTDAVHYEPHLIDLFTVPVVPGQIVTVWEGNLRSCPKRQFKLHQLDLVTPARKQP